jgi:hypothetical protein
MDANSTQLAAIVEDTRTTLPALIEDVNNSVLVDVNDIGTDINDLNTNLTDLLNQILNYVKRKFIQI